MFNANKPLTSCFLVMMILLVTQQQLTASCSMQFLGSCNDLVVSWTSLGAGEEYELTFITHTGKQSTHILYTNEMDFTNTPLQKGAVIIVESLKACGGGFPQLIGLYDDCDGNGSIGIGKTGTPPTHGFAAVAHVPKGSHKEANPPKNVTAQPNPFQSTVDLQYELTKEEPITVSIHNMRGQTVAILVDNKVQPIGRHQLKADLKDLPAGVYYYTLQTNGQRLTKKLLKLQK